MSEHLPDGITLAAGQNGDLEEEVVPFEHHIIWGCDKCNLSLEAFLLTPNGRFEGLIRNRHTQYELWFNKLPREYNKALKYLEENLQRKVENHKRNH